MADHQTIRVNFSKPIPVFPLSNVVLLPHAVLPLHIFEERYRQMVNESLDSAGQIAMATIEPDALPGDTSPPLRSAVCLGQIAQHHKLDDGRYNIILQGICRARIAEELPADADTLYRRARLEPIGIDELTDDHLSAHRHRFITMLSDGPLEALTDASAILEHLEDDDIPTSAVLELLAMTFLADSDEKYKILAEPDIAVRADIVEAELVRLTKVIKSAEHQAQAQADSIDDDDLPKGVSLN